MATTTRTTASRTQRSASRGDRARKATLGTAAGAIPLALSMLVSNATSKPAKTPHAVTRTAAHRAPADFSGLAFNPGCRLPFTSTPVADIDNECSIDGAGNTDAKIAESHAKNDFCENESNVVAIEYQTFLDLQKNTHGRVGKDRSSLAKVMNQGGTPIGEGTVVEYEGYLLHAQYSNKNSGEAVNCNIAGADTNDIHIQLVNEQTPDDDDACDSVTAQMSPHFRPETWTPDQLNSVRNHLLRLRGPLFFDGSHTPCHDNKRPNPQRASVWEIHPVYGVDVCKDVTRPAGKSSSATPKCQNWIPLEEWNGVESSEDEEG